MCLVKMLFRGNFLIPCYKIRPWYLYTTDDSAFAPKVKSHTYMNPTAFCTHRNKMVIWRSRLMISLTLAGNRPPSMKKQPTPSFSPPESGNYDGCKTRLGSYKCVFLLWVLTQWNQIDTAAKIETIFLSKTW